MASKVLVPTAPFAKLQVNKSPPEASASGFFISGDAAGRVVHLEHSVRFLQEQHRLMLGGLHAEIEALRERNRDLQFQLIFNKESSSKAPSPASEDAGETSEEPRLKREISRLESEAAAARGEARAAEARALQLQQQLDAQAEKLRELELKPPCSDCTDSGAESRAELRARLADAERLVRRLRGDADRQRRELQCMKNSLQASLRASGLEPGFGFHNSYHFPPVHTSDFWREPLREDYNLMGSRGRNNRRPLTLPELSTTAQQIHNRSTVYANLHTRGRSNGYENKNKKGHAINNENVSGVSPEEPPEFRKLGHLHRLYANESHRHQANQLHRLRANELYRPHANKFNSLHANELHSLHANELIEDDKIKTYPEIQVVVAKLLPQLNTAATNGQPADATSRPRARRNHHRKHATAEHT